MRLHRGFMKQASWVSRSYGNLTLFVYRLYARCSRRKSVRYANVNE